METNKDKTHTGKDTPIMEKKPILVQYHKQSNKVEMRSVTPENVQECLEDMGLDFFKYNKFKAQQARHQHMNMLDEIEDL